MRLFSEKVSPTFTSSNLNILTVEDFQEVFFDVFEFEINGKKFIAEKVSEYKGSPVIDIPLVLEGKEFTAPFVLQTGKFEILFNKNNSTFVKEVVYEQQEPAIEYVDKDDEVEELIFEKKEDILKEIAQARQSAERYVDKLKQQKISEATQYFDKKKKALDAEINKSKKGLLDEFLSLVENVKGEFFEFNEKEREKLSTFIESSISELADQLVESIEEKQEVAEKRFNEQLNELATNILSGVLLKEISSNNDKNAKDINERFVNIANNLKTLLQSERDEIDGNVNSKLKKFNESIVNLERTNIELNDLINKGDNRALSRIGNVKSQLEETISNTKSEIIESIQFFDNQVVEGLTDTINIVESNITDFCNAKIETAEDKIKAFYDNKLTLIEEKVEDLSADNKQYFLNLINESKQSLLNEIANIKVDVPNIVIEKSNGKQEVDLKGIKSELEKIIGTRFSNELQALKRLIEMSSGGGSVAKQFADGGTMNGSLTVVGSISASQYLGIPRPDLSLYLPTSGGTITGSLSVNSLSADRIFTTQLDALSANITVIDIKQYELSGFNVQGDCTIQGNVSASGSITANNLVYKRGNTDGADLTIGTNDDRQLNLETNGNTRMTITSGGNVGIGTTTPTEKLTVSGNISASGVINTSNLSTSGTKVIAPNNTVGPLSSTPNNQLATLLDVEEALIWTPQLKITPATASLNISGGNFSASATAATALLATNPYTATRALLVESFTSSGFQGGGTNFVKPWKVKFQFTSILSLASTITSVDTTRVSARWLVGISGQLGIPVASADPIPPGAAAIGIEHRVKPNTIFTHQLRLIARSGVTYNNTSPTYTVGSLSATTTSTQAVVDNIKNNYLALGLYPKIYTTSTATFPFNTVPDGTNLTNISTTAIELSTAGRIAGAHITRIVLPGQEGILQATPWLNYFGDLNSLNKTYDVVLENRGNGTANMYVRNWLPAVENPTRHDRTTPAATLTTCPSASYSSGVNSNQIMFQLINDGVTAPAFSTSNNMYIYPTVSWTG